MSNTHYWTAEKRQEQRERINRTKPWLKSTGARTPEGKAIVSRNAFKGGLHARIRALTKQANAILREQRQARDWIL